MADEPVTKNSDSDVSQSELAHSIIESLLDHTRVVSDLIAVMAQALDDDTQKALVLTAQWQAYLESRRQLERTRDDIERFVNLVAPQAKD
ncbi:MAG TPA: hypothetical protein VJT71_04600 [Pyrinomonadaceae bacterium]|nr:hypothetical protein [Pyrinomonadaceae bacterium]